MSYVKWLRNNLQVFLQTINVLSGKLNAVSIALSRSVHFSYFIWHVHSVNPFENAHQCVVLVVISLLHSDAILATFLLAHALVL